MPSSPHTVESTVESFDAQRSAARKQVQEAIELTAKVRVEDHIPRFRHVRVACLLEGQKTDRVALPAWVLAYRYRNTPYRAIVHGQRGEVVFGSSPKDWVKILIVVIGILVVVAAIAALLGDVRWRGGRSSTRSRSVSRRSSSSSVYRRSPAATPRRRNAVRERHDSRSLRQPRRSGCASANASSSASVRTGQL